MGAVIDPSAAEPSSLPAPAIRVLESFQRMHPGAQVRVWRREGDRTACVYPGAGRCGGEPAASAVLRPLGESEDGAVLAIEVAGAGVDGPAAELLAESVAAVLRYESEARSAARELSERYEEINLLYSISEVLGTEVSFDAAAHRILSDVADVLAARRASLWVLDPSDQTLHLAAAVGERGLSGPIPIDDPDSVTARVFRERQPLNLERGKGLPRTTSMDPRPQGQEAFLSVPINFTPRDGEGRTIGVITLVGRRTNVRFSAGDARLLTAIASQVGAALETHRLMAESVRRERLERELELAHDLQLKLLPEASGFAGVQVAARCMPAESVGGDFYHLFRLSGDRFGIMIGDVSSHGFSAALIMAMVMSAAAIYAQEAGPPAEVLRRVHGSLIDELESTEMHLSLFYGVLDPAAGTLRYANAGHPHAFRIGASGAVHRLGATNPPLGTLPLDDYDAVVVPWTSGSDLLCLFTDGLSDVFAGPAGAGGEACLLAEVVRLRDRAPADILEHLFRFAGKSRPTVPQDDRTAVLLKT
ncbi:MAG TPA: GAF domain-containing SpoIIE family protein phosphatase [Longimicrobiales bacterium]